MKTTPTGGSGAFGLCLRSTPGADQEDDAESL